MMDMTNYLCDEEIFNLLYKYDCNMRVYHLQKVAHYSNLLVNLLGQKYNFTCCDKSMIKYAALLHDIGYFINSEKHHKHSKYIILSDGLFDKLPDGERSVLALLVASHRRKLDKEIKFYPSEEQRKITELIAILRLADALDFDDDYTVDRVHLSNNVLHVTVGRDMDEKYLKKLLTKSELFKETFNLEIDLSIYEMQNLQ